MQQFLRSLPPYCRSGGGGYSPSPASHGLLAGPTFPDTNRLAFYGVLDKEKVNMGMKYEKTIKMLTLPQNVQVYLACCVTSI
jgi:hypothetical protein